MRITRETRPDPCRPNKPVEPDHRIGYRVVFVYFVFSAPRPTDNQYTIRRNCRCTAPRKAMSAKEFCNDLGCRENL